ncbi:MAG: hypothetical protein BWY27_00683 [Bacteroidetes bacterium ADurb.Bin234]|nr:MAG: hypothetical protein BWY27_00683 [Bacteroidetes bacterium ADurb.Bin234]
MKKQLLLIASIILSLLCLGQEDKKWRFGVGGGIYQAPIMQGEKVEDKYFDLEYCGGFTAYRQLGKNKKHTLGLGIGYAHKVNSFNYLPNVYINSQWNKELIYVKFNSSSIILDLQYKYSFVVKSSTLGFILGVELLNVPVNKNNWIKYDTKYIDKKDLVIENQYSGGTGRPYFSFEKRVNVSDSFKINLAYKARFNLYKNKTSNRLFIFSYTLSEPDLISVYDNFFTQGLVINFIF